MGNVICQRSRTVRINAKRSEIVCDEYAYEPPNAFLDSYELNALWTLIVLLVNTVLLALFWFCSLKPRVIRDFTSIYLITAVGPLSFGVLCKMARNILIRFLQTPRASDPLLVVECFEHACFLAAAYSFTINTVIYIIHITRTANKRQPMSPKTSRLPYIVVFCIVAVLSFIDTIVRWGEIGVITAAIFLGLSLFASLLTFILCCLMCCVCCCCSRPRPEMDTTDPVVYDARTRLGWLIVFLCFAPAMVSEDYYSTLLRANLGRDIDIRQITRMSASLVQLFSPIFLLVPVFLLLPTYRSALFGRNQAKGTVLPTKA